MQDTHTVPTHAQLIAEGRKLEAEGYGKGKTCSACHFKKLACPVGVLTHRWQHICPTPECLDWATCPTKYKPGKHEYIFQYVTFLTC
jgi:hypothetical protein